MLVARSHAQSSNKPTERGPALHRPVSSENCGCNPSTRMIFSSLADSHASSRELPWGRGGAHSLQGAHGSVTDGPRLKTSSSTHTDLISVSASDKKQQKTPRACG